MTLLEVDDLTSGATFSVLNGATRTVILVGSLAFKLPSLRYGWRAFLRGLIANAIEREWWRDTHDERLCPVLFGIPGGWLVVMPRCGPVVHVAEMFDSFVNGEPCCEHDDAIHFNGICPWCIGTQIEEYHDYDPGLTIPAENKDDSFGWLGGTDVEGVGRLVAVDYGN